MARTGYPAFSNSAATTLPVFPVAPVTRILGRDMARLLFSEPNLGLLASSDYPR
jgi:hypothetical protein